MFYGIHSSCQGLKIPYLVKTKSEFPKADLSRSKSKFGLSISVHLDFVHQIKHSFLSIDLSVPAIFANNRDLSCEE